MEKQNFNRLKTKFLNKKPFMHSITQISCIIQHASLPYQNDSPTRLDEHIEKYGL